MHKNILVTGGTGKTGRNVVTLLQQQGLTPRIASRTPSGAHTIRFDWRDPTTFKNTFKDIESAYLVAPTDDLDSMGAMQLGLEYGLEAGVKRFVLLSASSLEENGPMMGAVHSWLRENAPEWAVLRPSWFMQNLSEGQHQTSIREENTLYSATQSGRMGFISAQDIAKCAAVLLTVSKIENTDHILTGPEAVSYDDIAEVLSRHLDRAIKHQRISAEEMANRFLTLGYPEDYANGIAAMDDAISHGSEDRTSANVVSITGASPLSVERFIINKIDAWQV